MENKKIKKELDSDPRPMAWTVKAVVLNEKNEILILKRAADVRWNAGKFDLPGGHIAQNESYKETIVREIEEETGLKTVFEEVIDVVEFPKDNPLFKEEKRGIRCICLSESEEVKLSAEHEEFLWLPIEKALEKFDSKNGFEKEKIETIEKAKKYLELKNSLNGWKRERADFENFKKRQFEERKDLIAFSNTNLILEIIPVLDNFHASTDHIPEDQKENPWVVGIMYIQKQLEKVLEDNGVSEIEVKVGDKFDPSLMESISDKEQETCLPDRQASDKKQETGDKVKKVLMKGYKLDNKIIRAAKVTVE